jgi:ribosomal protein L7/L12
MIYLVRITYIPTEIMIIAIQNYAYSKILIIYEFGLKEAKNYVEKLERRVHH